MVGTSLLFAAVLLTPAARTRAPAASATVPCEVHVDPRPGNGDDLDAGAALRTASLRQALSAVRSLKTSGRCSGAQLL